MHRKRNQPVILKMHPPHQMIQRRFARPVSRQVIPCGIRNVVCTPHVARNSHQLWLGRGAEKRCRCLEELNRPEGVNLDHLAEAGEVDSLDGFVVVDGAGVGNDGVDVLDPGITDGLDGRGGVRVGEAVDFED